MQACRYLAERLTWAWENEEKQHPGQVLITPDGKFSEGVPSERLVPADANERIAIARRVVADRCLYGVDINPMAVEMAKLSLWLITVDAKRPFTFLDHAFKCGDSLLGITSMEQLENFSLKPDAGKLQGFTAHGFSKQIDEATKKRETLESMPSDTPGQIAAKAVLYGEAEEAVAKLYSVADVLVAVELMGKKGRAYEVEREASADYIMEHWAKPSAELNEYSWQRIEARKSFHWALAFPEIAKRGGFNAFVGNPPFVGGSKITNVLGDEYREFLVKHIASGQKGKADLCAYFFLRACHLLKNNGVFGLMATNSISQGDNRIVGLQRLVETGVVIIKGNSNVDWPGAAGVTVSEVWGFNGNWAGASILDGLSVDGISSSLSLRNENNTAPYKLSSNSRIAFRGTEIKGLGFTLEHDEAKELIRVNEKNSKVLFPYITGEDLNSRPDQSAARMAINFRNWSREEAEEYEDCFQIVTERVKPYRDTITEQIHEADYWKFWDKRLESYAQIASLDRVLVRSLTANRHSLAFLHSNIIFSHKVVVFGLSDYASFAILQSSVHEEWARTYCGASLRTDMSYSTKSGFETFPLPQSTKNLFVTGEHYYQYRGSIMQAFQEGLTKIYNRFNDHVETAVEIIHLRRLHVEMDQAVAAAYGWQDLELGHDFHETKQGIRYTISEAARREILARLLALNHQRHAEEETEKATLPVSATAKRGRKPKDTGGQIMMDL